MFHTNTTLRLHVVLILLLVPGIGLALQVGHSVPGNLVTTPPEMVSFLVFDSRDAAFPVGIYDIPAGEYQVVQQGDDVRIEAELSGVFASGLLWGELELDGVPVEGRFVMLTPEPGISVEGYVESRSSGFKFPDGSEQQTSMDVAGAVTSTSIADDAVTAAKIADSAVTSNAIANGAIIPKHIADNAVTGSHISDNVITGAKLVNGAVNSDTIADTSIAEADIADGAVTRLKIASGTITADRLSDNTIHTDKIQNNAVSTLKLQNGSVTNAKLAVDAVTSDKIADDSILPAHIAANTVSSSHIIDAHFWPQTLTMLHTPTEISSTRTRSPSLSPRAIMATR